MEVCPMKPMITLVPITAFFAVLVVLVGPAAAPSGRGSTSSSSDATTCRTRRRVCDEGSRDRGIQARLDRGDRPGDRRAAEIGRPRNGRPSPTRSSDAPAVRRVVLGSGVYAGRWLGAAK